MTRPGRIFYAVFCFHANDNEYKNRDRKTKFVTYLTKSRMYILRSTRKHKFLF